MVTELDPSIASTNIPDATATTLTVRPIFFVSVADLKAASHPIRLFGMGRVGGSGPSVFEGAALENTDADQRIRALDVVWPIRE